MLIFKWSMFDIVTFRFLRTTGGGQGDRSRGKGDRHLLMKPKGASPRRRAHLSVAVSPGHEQTEWGGGTKPLTESIPPSVPVCQFQPFDAIEL
jgi:hypothetical protein